MDASTALADMSGSFIGRTDRVTTDAAFARRSSMADPMPLRLHRAAPILSRTGDPGATDAQSACAEVAARIVILGEAFRAVLSGKEDALDRARRALTAPGF